MWEIQTIRRKEFIMLRDKFSKEDLEKLLDEYKSVANVAAYVSVSYSTVYSWYVKYGIKLLPSCCTIYDSLREIHFTDRQKSIVLGSILGDGCIKKNKSSKTARLQIGHGGKQVKYLEWKKEQLSPFVRCISKAEEPGTKRVICGKECTSSGYWIFNTIAHPDLNWFYNTYSFNGKKKVHSSIIDSLDEIALAIWMADDGSFSTRGKNSIRGSIATCSFSFEENEILIEALRKFYKGNITLSKMKDGNPILYLSDSVAIKDMLNIIVPILPECIHYKLVPQRLTREAPYENKDGDTV